MCGITGIYAFNQLGKLHMINLHKATEALTHRGPDYQDVFHDDQVGLGHRRLSIIDLSSSGNQPMTDSTGRFVIVYNGECYNFRQLRKELQAVGFEFKSNSDTEVVLNGYIHFGQDILQKIDGFFAFAIYDKVKKELFLARDRFGIKPLVYFQDEDKFIFASEIKSILAYGIDKEMNKEALVQYFQLNFIPASHSILKGVEKVKPGESIQISEEKSPIKASYYQPKVANLEQTISYELQKDRLFELLQRSVANRLVSDVPIGTFLSGGIDSSIISGLASREIQNLNTFSVGYKDEPFFDETHYANLVARHFNTNHHVIKLSNDDFLAHLEQMLNMMDEPFADSSAIAVNILSYEVGKHVKVILSGDGADEVFSGYHKHLAMLYSMSPDFRMHLVISLAKLWKILPQSRNNWLTNKFRQFDRFASGAKLPLDIRFNYWASFNTTNESLSLFSAQWLSDLSASVLTTYEKEFAGELNDASSFNDVLLNDLKTILPDDMLKKVDSMSMSHGLEVRVPFLNHDLVDFAFSLPVESKINGKIKKRILQDTFQSFLPDKLYRRPKKGFEVPLLKWFRNELSGRINKDLLDAHFIKEQGIFSYDQLKKRVDKMKSNNPGDETATIWALLVFQHWWKRYYN
jgi:asparagine synthase (glutamine-hydrolysing)